MLARVLNMRGVNLNLFQFDYDLTWAAFFLNAEEHVYGRFGGRDAESPDKYLTLSGLKNAMKAALEAHRTGSPRTPSARGETAPRSVEQYPAAKRVKEESCIHCHQVWDFRREELRSQKKWTRDDIWVYPLPDRLGFTVSQADQSHIKEVKPDSPAAEAGLRSGDRLQRIGTQPAATFADAQHALHVLGNAADVRIQWLRDGKEMSATLKLPQRWRESDISWRASMWGLEPTACVWGEDLKPDEKSKLGLAPKRLAFKQGKFVPAQSRNAGIRDGDIIIGIDGKELEMTMLQFNAWVRLNMQVGDKITFNVIRAGKRLDVPFTLPKRDSF